MVIGSQNFELLNTISQSLAGRTAIVKLLPFSLAEVGESTEILSLEHLLYSGFYPRIYDMGLNPTEALGFYVNTYVDRDLRTLLNGANIIIGLQKMTCETMPKGVCGGAFCNF